MEEAFDRLATAPINSQPGIMVIGAMPTDVNRSCRQWTEQKNFAYCDYEEISAGFPTAQTNQYSTIKILVFSPEIMDANSFASISFIPDLIVRNSTNQDNWKITITEEINKTFPGGIKTCPKPCPKPQ